MEHMGGQDGTPQEEDHHRWPSRLLEIGVHELLPHLAAHEASANAV